jgi:hypothetical protein
MEIVVCQLPAIAFLTLALQGGISGRGFVSPILARDVVHLLQNASLDAFAAADPDAHGRFVAALYVPEQLLVIETSHPSTAAIQAKIKAGQYRNVYLDLQGSASPDGRFFVLDAGADGLLATPPAQRRVDVVDDGGARPLLFNTDIRGQHLSESEYNARLASADVTYTHALTVLKAALQTNATYP